MGSIGTSFAGRGTTEQHSIGMATPKSSPPRVKGVRSAKVCLIYWPIDASTRGFLGGFFYVSAKKNNDAKCIFNVQANSQAEKRLSSEFN